jgi:hypothetical protein
MAHRIPELEAKIMDKIYDQFTLQSFKKAAVAAMTIGDLALFIYIYLMFSDKDVYTKSLDIVLGAMPEARGQLPPDFALELYSLMTNALITMLVGVFLYHALVHTLWIKKNIGFARGYVALYAWVAGPLCTLSGLTDLYKKPMTAVLFLFIGALFLFVALGLSRFPEPRSNYRKEEK